tara:strand:- start:1205 stop:1627 length:423 start_codon:yes stop_codon:yes gene_type:complete
MLKKIFKKTQENKDRKDILVASLLIHAAKIDEKYTSNEKEIIKKALIDLKLIDTSKCDELLKQAEEKEKNSNQILEFTREIKKTPMEFRFKIIEILWKIIYSDLVADSYESSLVRRICGLIYVSDRDSGEIRLKVRNHNK